MEEQNVPANLAQKVVRGTTLAGAGFAITQLIGIFSYVLIARLAPPATVGAFAAASIVIGLGTTLAESGMQAALIQRRDRLEEAASTALVATVLAGIGLGILALAGAPIVGMFFNSREVGVASAVLSGVLLLNAMTVVPDALMQRRFSFLRRVVVDPLNMACFGVTAAVALAAGMGIWGLVLATYIAGLIRVVAVWALARWRPRLTFVSLTMWRELATFGRHVVAGEFLRQVSSFGNVALVGRVLGAAPLGQFRFGYRLATQTSAPLVTASAYALLPAFARIAADEARLRAAALNALRVLCTITFPVSLILIPLGRDIAVMLFGEPWAESGEILAALWGLTGSIPVTQLATEVFKAAGRPEFVLRTYAISSLLSLALMGAFLPLGVVGVATGLSVASLSTTAYALHALGDVLKIKARQIARELVPSAVASIAMLGIVLVFERFTPSLDPITSIGVELSIATAAYLLLLRLTAPHLFSQLLRLATFSTPRRNDSVREH
jgi:O-antigen/teichoic acid export membrane protein